MIRRRRAPVARGLAIALAALVCQPTPSSAALSASVADASMAPTTVGHDAQLTTGSLTLTATDTGTVAGATNAGWNVTLQSSNLAYSGPNAGSNIPASHLVITTAHAPTRVSGQEISTTGGPRTTGATGSLAVARKTMQADGPTGVVVRTYHGIGTYRQVIDVSLAIPAGARAGTYTATLTVTISAGP